MNINNNSYIIAQAVRRQKMYIFEHEGPLLLTWTCFNFNPRMDK